MEDGGRRGVKEGGREGEFCRGDVEGVRDGGGNRVGDVAAGG